MLFKSVACRRDLFATVRLRAPRYGGLKAGHSSPSERSRAGTRLMAPAWAGNGRARDARPRYNRGARLIVSERAGRLRRLDVLQPCPRQALMTHNVVERRRKIA